MASSLQQQANPFAPESGAADNPGYRLQELVHRGDQYLVFKAFHPKLGGVAVKLLRPEYAARPAWRNRLRTEVYALTCLTGLAVVRVLEPEVECEVDGQMAVGFAMEWLEGETYEHELLRLWAKGERPSLSDVVKRLSSVVDVLHSAHQRGIVHRDVKPGNIFVRSSGETLLVDFGLARCHNRPIPDEDRRVVGTPGYVAPECWQDGMEDADERVDQYAFTGVVFRALTGEPPFMGSDIAISRRARFGPRPALSARRRDLPRSLDGWGFSGLAVRPDERFRDIRKLWNEFLRAAKLLK